MEKRDVRKERIRYMADLRRFVRQEFSYLSSQKILDAGCGTGPVSRIIKKNHPETVVIGIDKEAKSIIIGLRSRLSAYDSVWSSIPIYEDYGFIPLRDEFIDALKESGTLLDREYAVLKELNRDASTEFSKIDQKYGFDGGRTSYSYYRLRSEGKIRRVTMTMQKLPVRYVGMILMTIVNKSKFIANKAALLLNIMNGTKVPTDKYLTVYDTTTPDGIMFFVPVFNYDELDKTVEEIRNLGLGVKLTTLVASNILVGDFCYRKFDSAYSEQQLVLEKEYGVQKADKLDYENTGRKRNEERFKLDIRGARIAKETSAELSQTLP